MSSIMSLYNISYINGRSMEEREAEPGTTERRPLVCFGSQVVSMLAFLPENNERRPWCG